MMKLKKITALFSLLVVSLFSAAMLSSCSSDDDSPGKGNFSTVEFSDGGGVYVVKMNVDGALGHETLEFTIASNLNGKTIDLSQQGAWKVKTSFLSGDGETSPLAEGSKLMINKKGGNTIELSYKLRRGSGKNLIEREGHYEGEAKIK